ncbi:MAG: hypothetical protein KGH69_03300 [Candidatus Micrarchaeota archaeon]|nr:hypothetical protein [Candidatus Micrarchaeota archaeon]
MAQKDGKQGSHLMRYALVVVLALAIMAAYLLTQNRPQPSTTTTTSTATTIISYVTTAYVNNTSTIPTTTVPQLSNNVYCIGGYNGTSGNATGSAFYATLSQGGISNWSETLGYPISISRSSCVQYGSTIYCVGGLQELGLGESATISATYYLNLPLGNLSIWNYATPYPQQVYYPSCVTSNGMIYCISGVNATNATVLDYYAALNSSGTLDWHNTSPYPLGSYAQSCSASNGFVYCVGGYLSNNANATNYAYYAALNGSGIGQWKKTASYPVGVVRPACVISNGYIYCVGNSLIVGAGNSSYYAPVSASGIGNWMKTTGYPLAIGGTYSCVSKDGIMYCTGGGGQFGPETNATYYAQLSSSGIGKWHQASPYPMPIAAHSCVSA